MSQIVKINLTMFLSVATAVGMAFGAFKFFTKRDADVDRIQHGLNLVAEDVRSLRAESKIDHDTLTSISRDLKWFIGDRSSNTSQR